MFALFTGYPAYGRAYPSAIAMKQDFLDGKDFSASAQGGPYFSVRDFQENEPHMKAFSGVVLLQANPGLRVIVSRENMWKKSPESST